MSLRRPSSEHGFTLLECQVALLVLTLAVIFMSKMISSHDVLLQGMDGWLEGDDPTYYVVPREKDFERYLEHAPGLSLTAPVESGGGGGGGNGKGKGKGQGQGGGVDLKYEVSILSATRSLGPPSISVLVNLRNR